MSKEKQTLEEMAKIAFPYLKEVNPELLNTAIFGNINIAKPIENLYKAGYRKQEEAVWEFHKDGSGTCSRCHHTQKAVYDDDHYQAYCGVCGSKMKGE